MASSDEMTNSDKLMSFDFVSPRGRVLQGSCRQIIAPSVDGEIGILYDHEPVLTGLKSGQVRISHVQDKSNENGSIREIIKVNVTGGFLSVDSNEITVVADSAEIVSN
jgi:F-type H+-transporting ATPase subunit epsilon